MKQVINGKLYNTKTAKKICSYNNGLSVGDFCRCDFELYRTKSGNFFAHGSGGANSIFSRSVGQNTWSGGSGIVPIDAGQALMYAESCNSDCDTETIIEYFNVQEA